MDPAQVKIEGEGRDDRGGSGGAVLGVWPAPGVLAIFRAYGAECIDFDVGLREPQGQERLDVLLDLLIAIGRSLGKPVSTTPEGDHGHPVLGYDVEAGRVVLPADPGAYGFAEATG
ncbi:hypothetical protein AB0G15_20640 [Streptosporangium sp. NPDC023825]|uniref:hypothetical protein n=1 Tax=Streptosporangium sp. NPDC023825 TaxID=3154909 RepID=UPI0034364425